MLPIILPRDVWENIISRYLDWFHDLPKLKTVFPELNFRRKPRLQKIDSTRDSNSNVLKLTITYLDSYIIETVEFVIYKTSKIRKSLIYYDNSDPRGSYIRSAVFFNNDGLVEKRIMGYSYDFSEMRLYDLNGNTKYEAYFNQGKLILSYLWDQNLVLKKITQIETEYEYSNNNTIISYSKNDVNNIYIKKSYLYIDFIHTSTSVFNKNKLLSQWTYEYESGKEIYQTFSSPFDLYILYRKRNQLSVNKSIDIENETYLEHLYQLKHAIPFYSDFSEVKLDEENLISITNYYQSEKHGYQLILKPVVKYGRNNLDKKEGFWKTFEKGVCVLIEVYRNDEYKYSYEDSILIQGLIQKELKTKEDEKVYCGRAVKESLIRSNLPVS